MKIGRHERKDVGSLKSFRVYCYIVGYRRQGESIVVLFVDTSTDPHTVLYSIVIDCYIYEHINLTRRILEKHGVDSMSLLCWTHPDLDHSVGLAELVENKTSNDTIVLLPEYFHNKGTDVVTLKNKDAKVVVDNIFMKNGNAGIKISHIAVPPGGSVLVKELLIKSSDESERELPVKIECLTPQSTKITDYYKYGKKYALRNDISISLLIDIDEYCFFFSGDITNEMIEEDIADADLKSCRFIKVPHHGSPSSIEMLNHLGEDVDVAAFTRKTIKLPDNDIYNAYKDNVQVVSVTGTINHESSKYGIVLYEYDFSGDDVLVTVTPYNNAIVDKGKKYKDPQ